MSALIEKLFTEEQVGGIRKLWDDKNCRLLIEQQIGIKLLENQEIIQDSPWVQILCITSLASFASDDQECIMVANILSWGMTKTEILPLVSEHKGKDLAYRCLISLSFHTKAIERRHQRRGAPSPDFYRHVGQQSFHQLNMPEIEAHFNKWTAFLPEMFC